MLRVILSIMVLMLSVLSTWQSSDAESSGEITVSAAISLKNTFVEIGKVFEAKNKGTKINFNSGASGDLIRQIEAGAPVDVFASAALKDMDEIDRKGLVIRDTRVNFAGNVLVLIIPSNSGLQLKSFNDLQREDVKRIAVGNPKTVPVGRYSEETLKYFGILDNVKSKLIFAENVRQVLDYVARGEVDAGMVYSTDALVRPKEMKIAAEAPEGSHKPVIYPIAVIRGTKDERLAREFILLVTSQEGKRILERYGFNMIKR